MANYAWIKRIVSTMLTRIYMDALESKSEVDLMEGLSNDQYHFSHNLAIKVIEAAHAGDPAALEVMQWTGEELGGLAMSVARHIEIPSSRSRR